MATVIQSNIGIQHEKVSIVITKEDYTPGFDKAVKNYTKQATIPGFRKGMVPAGQVKKMYGNAIFSDEVLRIAGSEMDKYVEQNKLKLFVRPLPMDNGMNFKFDYTKTDDYTFDFEIGLQPEIRIPMLDGRKKFEAYKVNISDAMIDEEVEKLRYKSGKMNDVTSITHEDNVLNVTFEACDSNGNLLPDATKIENSLLLKYFNSNFQSQLMGKENNDAMHFSLAQAIDEKLLPAIEKDLGLNVGAEENAALFFKMTIVKVALVDKAAVEAGLFEDVYPGQGVATEEEFRNRLKNEIALYWEGQGRNKLHNDLFETLVHETPLDLPVDFLKRYLEIGGEQLKSKADVEKEWPEFDHSLRWQLVSDKLIADNKISVSKEELEEATKNNVKSYFAQMGMSAGEEDAPWVQGVVDKQMKDKKYVSETYNRIITDKLFMWLENQIDINMNDLPLEEFIKLPSSHHHHH